MRGANGGLPKAILLDLDDTILDDSGSIRASWRIACAEHAAEAGGLAPDLLHQTIARISQWYWADPERHRLGRLRLLDARREVVRLALADLGAEAPETADRIAETYAARRDEAIAPFVGAIETVMWLRESGCRMALLTNGNGVAQREKIVRFDLERWFDAILIEGEQGYGKPDPRVYEQALGRLGVAATDTWMVGDHLEWDVAAPQRVGIHGIWVDGRGHGPPEGSDARPDRVIRTLVDLRTRKTPPDSPPGR